MIQYDFTYVKQILYGLQSTLMNITNNWVYKAFAAFFTGIAAYYAGIQIYIFAIGFLVVADVFTGTWSSFKQGHKFSSKKLGKGLIQKTVVYLLIMATSFEIGKVLQSAISHETHWLSWILTLLILLYELTSIIENILVINPDLVFLKRFSGLFEKVVSKQIDNVEETLGNKKEEEMPEVPEPDPVQPEPVEGEVN